MKTRIFFAIVCGVLWFCQPVYAEYDICRLAGQAIGMDAEGVDAFFEDHIKDLLIAGRGEVLEVNKGAGDHVEQNYTLRLDCGNGVLIVLEADAFWVENRGIREGRSVSFRGRCLRIMRIGNERIECIVDRQD